jgi:Putative bacterial sensory transduction regulator
VRTLRSLLTPLAIAAGLVISASHAAAEPREVFTRCTNRMIEKTLKAMGYAFTELENDAYRFDVDGMRIVIFNKSEDIQLYAGWDLDGTTLNRVNEFNREKRWAKAYLDDDGDPVIEADLDFEGGVTQDSFERFIKLFVQVAALYAEHLAYEPAMNASSARCAASSGSWRGGCFMKADDGA